ncbi:MAG: FtsX-like permease family protein [Bacillota bacterium]|nr:FtsX-like permease family protein [Bacillota bacterium]
MNVFSKYLLKSMLEKKGRALLLLLSIGISTALLVASLGSVKALLGSITNQVKGDYGDFNVAVSPGRRLEVPLFDPSDVNSNDIMKSYKGISIGGYLSNDNEKEFDLRGTSLSDFKTFGNMTIIKDDNLEPFAGKKLIISQKTSERLKVKVGDELKLNILGKDEIYKIAATAANKGLFGMETEKRLTFVTPEENVFSIYNKKGQYSEMLLSVKTDNLDTWIKDFNKKNKENKITASKIFDEQIIEQQLNMLKMPLFFMLGIVLIMTTFIIYSSFKLIITERLSIIGTFLSQGATKGRIIYILLKESLAYGVLGAIIGDAMGAGLTALIAYAGNPLKDYGVKPTVEYYIPYFVGGFIFAIALSLLSTLVPILSIRKLPIKDVILNTVSASNKISIKGFVVGLIFIISAVILHFTGEKMSYRGAIFSIILAFFGVMLIIPKLVDWVCCPLVRGIRNLNGLSMLSFNNVRTSRLLINNMRLITISIISILIIAALKTTMMDTVSGAYEGMKFDVGVTVTSNYSKNIYDIIHEYPDASNIIEVGSIMGNLNGDTTKIMNVQYVDPLKYKNFENYTVFKDKEKELNALNEDEDGIIISRQVSLRYNIKQGDTVAVNVEDRSEKFKVLSIYDAKLMDSGNLNLISLKAASKHFDIKYPTNYWITTKDSPNDAKKALEKKLKGLGATLITRVEMMKQNNDNNMQMANILSIFSYITMIIGAFGIVSNVSISFIQRKRDMAVISSVGLTKGGRGYMIVLEGIFQALVGVCISLVAAYGINTCLTDIFKFLTMDMDLKYPVNTILPVIITTILLMLVTSLSSVIRSRKLQIVQELKFE